VFVWSSSGVSSLKECPQIYSKASVGIIFPHKMNQEGVRTQ
jgi:hypothetical protein